MGKVIRTVYLKNGQIRRDQVDLACSYLNDGGVVALPTDTIYGIAAKVDDKDALGRLYDIKGRDKNKPLAVCVASVEGISSVADISHLKLDLLRSLLPGPVTVLLKRGPNLDTNLNPGLDSVGVRVPDHNFLLAVCSFVGPIALTSANRSGQPSSVKVEDFKDLVPELDCTFDCGQIRKVLFDHKDDPSYEPGSTVIDLTQPKFYKIVRAGRGLNRAMNILDRHGYRNKPLENI